MGITGLTKLLRKLNLYQNIHISDFAYKKIAVDTSLYIYKFKNVMEDRWLSAFLSLILCLRKNNVHPVFIFDTGCPVEKKLERESRSQQKKNMISVVETISNSLNKYYETGTIDSVLTDIYNAQKPGTKLLLSNTIDISIVEDVLKKMRKNIVNIYESDIEHIKELLTVLSIPFYNAPVEAETMCSDLCKRGLVDAVLSEDSDIVAYATPMCLSKLNTSTGNCEFLYYEHVLYEFELSQESFLDFCILCGTDYNKNMPGIGPVNSQKIITKYKKIELLPKDEFDVSILNFVNVRKLFTEYEKSSLDYVPFCAPPKYSKYEEFRVKHHLFVSVENIKEIYTCNFQYN